MVFFARYSVGLIRPVKTATLANGTALVGVHTVLAGIDYYIYALFMECALVLLLVRALAGWVHRGLDYWRRVCVCRADAKCFL
jgi:hypothetical protein